ncbi:hypothetical protein [Caldimonas sp.]|uniref:hypothetical protein n=1 Tax=Caldimonas sp. TaxID=2838790 RepID=UPI00391CEEEB
MDLSELSGPTPAGRQRPAPPAMPEPATERWHRLLTQIGEEIAAPLSSALERVHGLIATGQIDRRSLRSLRDELERARRVGMCSQQIVRFASGRVRQSAERLHLTQTLQGVLAHRSRETQSHGLEIRQVLKPVEVIVDPALLFSLLNTLLDWALTHAQGSIELRLDTKPWPVQARLLCRFHHTPPDEAGTNGFAATLAPQDGPALDDVSWCLVQQAAATMGLELERQDGESATAVTLLFPRTVADEMPGLSVVEEDTGFAVSSANSRPLAGSHVLVVASRREVRVQVREAIRHMGLVVDFVSSVDEAAAFCREGLPHAVIIESILRGERFNQLREDLTHEAPDLVFIEIVEEGDMFEVSGFGHASIARVGRGAILTSLPSALLFELSKTM